MVVEGLFYTKEHEWAKIEGNTATIGITDHAQDQMGELVFAELPEVSREVNQNDDLAVVESSKAASDVYAPCKGKITEVNEELNNHPELINEDAYGKGWICKLEIAGNEAVENLMDAEQYKEFLKGL